MGGTQVIRALAGMFLAVKGIVRRGDTFADVWEDKVKALGDKSFMEFEGQTWTYAKTDAAANRLARWFQVSVARAPGLL